jgi:hypothetical protein
MFRSSIISAMHFIIQMRAATVLNSREGELLCLTKRFLKRE